MSHEHHREHFGIKLGFEIAKLVVKGIAATAAVCMAKNIYKVHKSIEAHRR